MILLQDFFIAGVAYHEYQMATKLKAGSSLRLVGEPSNKHDPLAIKIMFNDFKLGYVPTELCKTFWDIHKRGVKIQAVLLSYNKQNVTHRMLRVRASYISKPEEEKEIVL